MDAARAATAADQAVIDGLEAKLEEITSASDDGVGEQGSGVVA